MSCRERWAGKKENERQKKEGRKAIDGWRMKKKKSKKVTVEIKKNKNKNKKGEGKWEMGNGLFLWPRGKLDVIASVRTRVSPQLVVGIGGK